MKVVDARAPEGAEEWQAYYELRWEVLRAPWKQPRGSERDEYENSAIHRMVCTEANRIVAVGRLHYLDARTAQIRYMAVAESCRQHGFGTLILRALETVAWSGSCSEIHLQARESSLPFYQKAGYQVIEKSHILYNEIQHFKMRKRLADQPLR